MGQIFDSIESALDVALKLPHVDGILIEKTDLKDANQIVIDGIESFFIEDGGGGGAIPSQIAGVDFATFDGHINSTTGNVADNNDINKYSDYIDIPDGTVFITFDAPNIGPGAGVNNRSVVYYSQDNLKLVSIRPDGSSASNYIPQDTNGTITPNGPSYPPPSATKFRFTIAYDQIFDMSNVIVNFSGTVPTTPRKIKESLLPVYVPSQAASNYYSYIPIYRFSYAVNVTNAIDAGTTSMLEQQDNISTAIDYGMLMLPTTYTQTGAPTRLVIGCHGGGGTVDAFTSQTETYDIYKYLVSQGYAVMDVGGLPHTFAQNNRMDRNRVMGSYIAASSYDIAYRHVISKYNIAQDGVFINGGSNGGLTSFSIAKHTNIPIIAMSGMSPLISMADNAWLLPSVGGTYSWATAYGNRLNIIKLYGMSDPEVWTGGVLDVTASQSNLSAAIYEPDKVYGFDPYTDGVYLNASSQACIQFNIPYKAWSPVDDPVVYHPIVSEFINRLKRGGSFAVLRTMSSGGHAPESAGATIGTFTYLNTTINLKIAPVELLAWYRKFEPKL